VGAFLVAQMLAYCGGVPIDRAVAMVKDLEDDVVLRDGDGAVHWITRWTNGAAARTFAEAYGALGTELHINRDGEIVSSTTGSPDSLQAALAALRASPK
jgi:hypothetical protein